MTLPIHIRNGLHVIYSNPFGSREAGTVKFHAQDRGFWLVKPDQPGTLQLIHETDVIATL